MAEPTIHQTVIGDHNIFTAQGDIRIVYELPPAEAEDRRNLLILLNKVRQFWIQGVLEQSVYHEALIQLGKESRPEMVAHPWERMLELPNQDIRQLPPDKKIGEIFDETGRALLIVGEPGSGKTITLLELARDLATKAEGNPTQPVPVVFNLSTWTAKHPAIFDWLVNELSTKYQVSKSLGRTWIKNRRLTLLFDGLDEVALKFRAACVSAVNEFFDEYGLPGLVVCCRLQEYLALPKYLKLSGAICLLPLTRSQVEDYLLNAGPKLASLHIILRNDHVLQELAETPLMLSVMSLAYQDMPVEALSREETFALEGRRQHLFDFYIERMLRRKGKADQPYARPQVIGWLQWLAQRMTQHSLSALFIEELQPSWLATRNEKRFFKLWYCLLPGLSVSLSLSVAFNLSISFHYILMFVSILFEIFGWKYKWSINPVENLRWSWLSVKMNIKSIYYIIPLTIMTLIALGEFLVGNFFNFIIFLEILFPLLFTVMGIKKSFVNNKTKINQGIRLSISNMFFLFLIFSLWLSLIYLLNTIITSVITSQKIIFYQFPYMFLNYQLVELVSFSFIFFLFFGGWEAAKHYVLRLILAGKGYAPLNYARFLDYATKLIFLRKVGGGYIFIHRMLLEHFAAMGPTSWDQRISSPDAW